MKPGPPSIYRSKFLYWAAVTSVPQRAHRQWLSNSRLTMKSLTFFLKSWLIRWVRSLCLCLSVKLRFAYVKQCVEKCDHCSLDSSHIVAFGSKSALFPKAIKNALMRNTVAQCDTFLLWHKHSHSSLFWVSPACTILLNSSPKLNIDASFLPLDKNDTSSFKKSKQKQDRLVKNLICLLWAKSQRWDRYTESTGMLKVTCLFGFTVTRE